MNDIINNAFNSSCLQYEDLCNPTYCRIYNLCKDLFQSNTDERILSDDEINNTLKTHGFKLDFTPVLSINTPYITSFGWRFCFVDNEY